MRYILFILFVIFSFKSSGQKNYRIENTIWKFTQPSGYILKIDNFDKEIKIGEEYVKKLDDENYTLSNDDKILLSIVKSDSSQVNMIFASYKNNNNIKKFTLKGTAEKLAEFFKVNPKDDNPKNNVFVKISEVIIDKKKFYLISKTTNYTEHNYSYTSDFYVTEIEGKEFSIVTIYDNEIDRQKIEKSITESTFR